MVLNGALMQKVAGMCLPTGTYTIARTHTHTRTHEHLVVGALKFRNLIV